MFTPKNLDSAEMGGVNGYLEDLTLIRGSKMKGVVMPKRVENTNEVMSENGDHHSEVQKPSVVGGYQAIINGGSKGRRLNKIGNRAVP